MSDRLEIHDAHFSAVDADEAGGMWCPEVRNLYADEDGSGAAYNMNQGVNGGRSRYEFATCVAARCMAWRWVRPGAVVHPGDSDDPPLPAGHYTHGYCGKAGGR